MRSHKNTHMFRFMINVWSLQSLITGVYRRLQASVILSTGGEGVCLSACWDARPPPDQAPPGADPPTRHTPPGADTPLPPQAHPPEQTPPGPGTHPRTRHPPPPTRLTPPEQTPPREADARIRSIGGRYASYWNAFLLVSVSTERSSVAVPWKMGDASDW